MTEKKYSPKKVEDFGNAKIIPKKVEDSNMEQSKHEQIEDGNCCCSTKVQKVKKGHTDSCCSEGENIKKHQHEDGCCSGEVRAKKSSDNCHCGADNKEQKHIDSCCSESGKTKHSKHNDSCCGESGKTNHSKHNDGCCSESGKTNHSQHADSCCGDGGNIKKHQHDDSCCGTVKHTDSCGCGGCSVDGDGKNYDKYILISSAILLLIGLFVNKYHDSIWLKIFNPSYFVIAMCGYGIFINAFRGIRNKKINSSLLISVAIVASIVLEILVFVGISEPDHYIFAAAEIAFLMKIGGALESYTVKKSKKGIKDLFNLMPKEAQILRKGEYITISVEEVEIGDIVLVKPNNMIPVDGDVVSGGTSVDQSNITGESLPIEKNIGDSVFSGTWNKQGIIEIRVTCEARDTSISKLVKMVEEAGGRKAPISRIADRWAGYIVPFAILISFGIFLLNFFALNSSAIVSLVRAVTILVVFCPCALALATPTAISAGIGNLAARGILVRSGEALEALAKADTIAFDKTGTLTKGMLSVSDSISTMDEDKFKEVMRGLEKNNDHPIAHAIAKNYENAKDIVVENYEIINGVGVRGKIYGSEYIISNFNYAKEHFEHDNKVIDFCKKMINLGAVVSILAENDKMVGAVALSDTIREGALEAIAELNKKYDTIMLTGDNSGAANYVNSFVGVKEVKSELLPEQKAKTIEELIASGKKVCMIGDGVNDAPSLALSSCSIAMAELGSELAVETAPISVMSSDVRKLPKLFAYSNKVMFTIKINIIISMSINFFAVIASAFGWLTPVTGAIVHNISSVLVVLNSCRLLNKKVYEGRSKNKNEQSAVEQG